MDHKLKKEIMPYIILKKEIKRTYGKLEKVFPEGMKIFVSWDHYHQLSKDGICDKIKVKNAKEKKLKEKKKTTSKK